MNKKRALSILMAAAMAAGTLVTSVPVYADDVEEITWMFWDDLEATANKCVRQLQKHNRRQTAEFQIW